MSDGVKISITMTEGALFVIAGILDEEAKTSSTREYREMLQGFAKDMRKAILDTPGSVLGRVS